MSKMRVPNAEAQRNRPRRWSYLILFAPLVAVIALSACQASPTPALTTPTLAASTPKPTPVVKASEEITGAISFDRNFYLIIDGSGSMTEKGCAGNFPDRVNAAKWAVREFILRSVPPEVNLGLYAFDQAGASERVPLGKANRQLIINEIDRIRGGGGTPLNRAIKTGVDALAKQSKRQLGYGELYIVVATDGEATDERGSGAEAGVLYAKQHAIPIITIGFCLASAHPLSKESISYRDVHNPQELFLALQETQAESTYFDSTVFEKR